MSAVRASYVALDATAVAAAAATCARDGSPLRSTGFRQDHSLVSVAEAIDGHSQLVHHRGVTPAPGLYVLGLPWLHTTGSALLGFVSRDAAYLAKQIKDFSRSSTR